MVQSFYDQIPHLTDRENSFVGFTKPTLIDDKYISEYEVERSKKKEETIRTMNERMLEYTYKV